MNVDDLKHFLEIEQGHSHVSRELCLEIMNECEPSTQLRKKEMLGLDSNSVTPIPSKCQFHIVSHRCIFRHLWTFGRSNRTGHFGGMTFTLAAVNFRSDSNRQSTDCHIVRTT